MKGFCITIGITGGIAAYKACELVSLLKKSGADVHVVMTRNATQFVTPLTLASLSANPVTVEMFQESKPSIGHISLAKSSDLCVIAPCSANMAAKIAHGIADDFLSTMIMATRAPTIICPAMNTNMYESVAYTQNALLLKQRGYIFVEPDSGRLACGDEGKGRLASIDKIFQIIKQTLPNVPKTQAQQEQQLEQPEQQTQAQQEQQTQSHAQDLAGKTILITAGATITEIDPVRYISNHSSGKMGTELARAAILRGARVKLILGKTTIQPDFDCEITRVRTSGQMLEAIERELPSADCVIKAAAPSDYVLEAASQKIKDESVTLRLKKGVDIAAQIGKVKGGKKLVIFAAETENLIENAQKKLKQKNADLVVANDVTKEGAGFDGDTNIVSILAKSGIRTDYPKMPKSELAHIILNHLVSII